MSVKKTAVIEIILHSDLCAGSGYSFAGIIDSDICYDDCGIPYIPAKRLKGCMRETAETTLYRFLGKERILELFGKPGSDHIQGITIGNAYIADYDSIHEEAAAAISHHVVNVQEILDQFTHVQAQTAMENGVAKRTALRYTRTVDQLSPFDQEPLHFYAEVSFDDEETDADQKTSGPVEKDLQMILRATNNLGLKRTRGMGSVSCRLKDIRTDSTLTETCSETTSRGGSESQNAVSVKADGMDKPVWKKIRYIINNEEPLMMSSNTDDHSAKYISGQSVLGALAGRYVQMKQNSSEAVSVESEDFSSDPDFRALFLGGEARYTNAYPYVAGRICYPAPEYLNQLKKTKKYVNTYLNYDSNNIEEQEEKEQYNPAGGNLPKKLKGKFTFWEPDHPLLVHDVDMEVRYHHSHRASARASEGLLYPMISVCKGQTFAGEIYVTENHVNDIINLLKGGPLNLGKSRTSQYGRCILVGDPVVLEAEKQEQFMQGQKILVELLSDTILVNDAGEYTVYTDEIRKIIADELGISCNPYEAEDASRITPCLLNGYLGTWNLRKQTIPAVQAGSCIPYILSAGLEVNKAFLGERNMEGFGQFRIRMMNEMEYVVPAEDVSTLPALCSLEKTGKLIADILVKKALQTAKLEAVKDRSIRVSNSALGRITLMLKESLRILNKEEAFHNFGARIESIKTDNVRKNAETAILGKFGTSKVMNNNDEKVREWTFNTIPIKDDVKTILESGSSFGIPYDELKKEFDRHWGEYLMAILISQKYEAAKADKKEADEDED